ncbi:transketolase [Fodinisporobacter ferrooxydans]|uniref:Transketolase n=1 Tax=Fodinisporobacter ferrooxydans TaxID=2901836 RepID=A0ABY4CF31_9BACL|nr:transketolase [Alicyclobacillaceae bacterium MYW30-H2]
MRGQVDVKWLERKAHTIRCHIVDMVEKAQSGHPGASLSAVEILTVLYFSVLNVDPQNPDWQDRDRFVLSKGHATPVYYSILAEKGFFPLEELSTFRKLNSRLQGHPDVRKTPGVDMTTGSLGQGFGSTVGMALALRHKKSAACTYALLGDGELNEGEIWEAAMIAAHYKLDRLVAVIDKNGKQASGCTKDILNTADLAAKWEAFGWDVTEVDGHDIEQLADGFSQAKANIGKGKPSVMIANTVKGRGISFMEQGNEFYGEKLTADEIARAKQELMTRGLEYA